MSNDSEKKVCTGCGNPDCQSSEGPIDRPWSFEEVNSPLIAHATRMLAHLKAGGMPDDPVMEGLFLNGFMFGAFYSLNIIRDGIEIETIEDGETMTPSYSMTDLLDEAADYLSLESDDDEEDDDSSVPDVNAILKGIVSNRLPRKD